MIKKLLPVIAVMFIAACNSDDDPVEMAPPEFTASTTYTIDLNGSQQVPNNRSQALATATLELDESLDLFRASLDLSAIENVSAAHIHEGQIGLNGDVVVAFEQDANGNYIIGETELTDNLEAQFASGNFYVNVHTTDFPNGEVRGQIVNDTTTVLTFALSGQQQVPAVSTKASGFTYASYDSGTGELRLTARTNGVDDATMAHIHIGRIGSNGEVLVGLEQATSDVSIWTAPADLTIDSETFDTLASGGHYVNIHTPKNPNGELRGQILTDNYALAAFGLSGQQEVPAVSTAASGSAYALVDTSDFSVELKVLTNGVEDATMAHIHTGRVGMNGDVLVGLEQSMDDPNIWMAPADLTIDGDTFEVLASGGHYVNVHTPANPGGELRGQILTDNYVLAAFSLSGQQEVPAVSTMATGSAYALIETINLDLELRAVTSGVEDATMAHIHTGRVGMNGGVLVGLEQSMDDVNVWMTPDGLTIDEDTFAVLASGGHYVNVHTPANPGGELRGQILTDNYVLAAFGLSGQQEVPAVSTMATGSAYALIDTNDLSVELQVLTSGVEDATMAHIHTGRVGMNGGVLVGLEQSMDDPNIWMAPADLTLDGDTFEVLASGGHYVNVHTPTNPGGELRGQILTDNFALLTFPLDGAQQVPANSSSADGDGYALVNLQTFELELTALTRGVEDATMAHIHTGVRGENGPVLVGLLQDMDDANAWFTPMDTSINADILSVLLSSGHYVNVHTPAFPGGEIRGQIE